MISIHAPAWGATPRPAPLLPQHIDFNPRTRMGCDSLAAFSSALTSLFQSTHPHGVRPPAPITPRAVSMISIHAPAWGATRPAGSVAADYMISIHAPAWGATRFPCPRSRASTISIHAPAWGATRDLLADFMIISYFNPRTRMGCDPAILNCLLISSISIHAPAWGATDTLTPIRLLITDFNPRTRMGCDGALPGPIR